MRTPDPDFSSNHALNPLLRPKKKPPQKPCFSFPSQSLSLFSPFPSSPFRLSRSNPYFFGYLFPFLSALLLLLRSPVVTFALVMDLLSLIPSIKNPNLSLNPRKNLKQMVKNPVGKPGRWEAIAAAFKGKHKMESVIKKAKQVGEKKVDDGDSYAKFLKYRKPLDMRINDENESVIMENEESSGDNNAGATGWSSGEDIALLNALKTFPKDVPMRWEKIAAVVPGKSKAASMKRVAELKRDYRSSKTSNEGN